MGCRNPGKGNPGGGGGTLVAVVVSTNGNRWVCSFGYSGKNESNSEIESESKKWEWDYLLKNHYFDPLPNVSLRHL